MEESQKIINIQRLLLKDQEMNRFIDKIQSIFDKYKEEIMKLDILSQGLRLLRSALDQFRCQKLHQALTDIRQPNTIVAFPIKRAKQYSLILAIVPSGKMFDFHSHPKMVGITSCFYGSFQISTIDLKLLQKNKQSKNYSYPKDKLKIEKIQQNIESKNSIIEPDNYNIHQIKCNSLSAFFDLLIPDYPENYCDFYEIIEQKQNKIFLQKLQTQKQQIESWDSYYKKLKTAQPRKKANFIVQ